MSVRSYRHVPWIVAARITLPVALLAVAFGFAVSRGHTGDAVIIGILLLVGIILICAALATRVRRR